MRFDKTNIHHMDSLLEKAVKCFLKLSVSEKQDFDIIGDVM